MVIRKTIFQVCLCFLLIFCGHVYADHQEHKFNEANKYYQNGQYEEAISAYEEILGMEYESAELYYNLGNSFYKLGKNPQAILNYERASRLKPNDEDIKFNLQITNLQVVDKIPSIPELFYVKFINDMRNYFSLHSLTLLTVFIYICFFTFLIIWLLIKPGSLRRIFKTLSYGFVVILILFSFLFISKVFHKRVDAIVMEGEIDVRSAPSSDGTEIFKIHEGLKVKITDRRGDWIEIRLSDGKEGWLESLAIEAI